MAKKKIDVEIGVKNKIAAGLKSVRASLKRFGATAGKIMKGVAVATVALGTAMVALGVKAVKAFAVQETAEKSLTEAMRAHGDAVDELLPKYKELASTIQDETGIADESTLATIAKLRTIGVANDKMETAVKLTLALGKAGMREKTALRAAADAMNGNTTQLTTYIPELRNAKTEAEKLAIVNDLMARGYQQLTGELDTNAGRWNELKGRIGDVLEKIGGALTGGSDLKGMLKILADKIKAFGASPKFDAFLDKIKESIGIVRDLFVALTSGGEQSKATFIAIGNLISEAFKSGAAAAVDLLVAAAPVIGAMIGAGAKAVISSVTTERDFEAAEKRLVDRGEIEKKFGRRQVFGGTVGTSDQDKAKIEREMMAEKIRQAKLSGVKFKSEEGGLAAAIASLKATIKPFAMPSIEGGPKITKPASPMTSGPQVGGISASTSMLSTGDLFTMMQTGSDSKATMVSEQQKTNEKLDKLIDLSGGVE